jgi:hypothetical protein
VREIGYVFQGFLCIADLIDGKPRVVRRGSPLPRIPEAEWQRLVRSCPSTFKCGACAEHVLAFIYPSAALMQMCRCTGVAHFFPAHPYLSCVDWSDFQAMYEREKRDPAPPEGFRRDPLTGQYIGLNETGKAWVRRKLGVASDVNISEDGTVLSAGDGSLYVDLNTGKCSTLADSQEGLAKVADALIAIRNKHGATAEDVPPLIVVIGVDDDYVWLPPPHTVLARIEPAPFRCPNCKARVKHAPVQHMGALDQTYLCLCMSVAFRRDTPRPQSSGEWNELRLQGLVQGVRHKTAVASDLS